MVVSAAVLAMIRGANAVARPCKGRSNMSNRAVSLRVITKKCLKTISYVGRGCARLGCTEAWILQRNAGSTDCNMVSDEGVFNALSELAGQVERIGLFATGHERSWRTLQHCRASGVFAVSSLHALNRTMAWHLSSFWPPGLPDSTCELFKCKRRLGKAQRAHANPRA